MGLLNCFLSSGKVLFFTFFYSKKAQKCFCGTDKCCGYIGGKSANILTDGSKIPTKANKSKKKTKKVSPVKVKDEFKEGGDEEEEKEEEEEEDDDDEEEEDNDEDDDLYNGVDVCFQLFLCLLFLIFTLTFSWMKSKLAIWSMNKEAFETVKQLLKFLRL